MAGKTLEDAIQMLIDNVDAAAMNAAHIVNKKMQEDWEKMAKGTVDKYYEYQKVIIQNTEEDITYTKFTM